MNGLTAWSIRHHVSLDAMAELRAILVGMSDYIPTHNTASGSEAAVSNAVRIEASQRGGRLWRNNVGAGKLEDGSFVRWGLCNDSAQLNKTIKSSDLIGIMPVTITPAHVGTVIGQFMCREVKRPGWTYKGTDREVAQLRWIESINAMGGNAAFATGIGTIK